MEEKQDKIVDVAKAHLINLKDKHSILSKRLEHLKILNDSDFTPLNPTRKFEEDANYVMTERDLIVNSLITEINKLEGQIEGQEELIYKLSKEGQEEYEKELQMIADNNFMKTRIKELEKELEDYKSDIEQPVTK